MATRSTNTRKTTRTKMASSRKRPAKTTRVKGYIRKASRAT